MTPTSSTRLTIETVSIPRINTATANAIREGANLAFLALEIQDIKDTSPVSMHIKNHLMQGLPVQPVIEMVKEQFAQGPSTWRALIQMFGKKLLRKIIKS